MAGAIITVIPRRGIDFSALALGGTQEIALLEGIDVSAWTNVALLVRTHVNRFTSNLGTIEIKAYLEGRSPDDPGILFAKTTADATITVTSSTAVGSYVIAALGSSVGDMVKVTAKGTRTGSLGPVNRILAEISVELSCRNG